MSRRMRLLLTLCNLALSGTARVSAVLVLPAVADRARDICPDPIVVPCSALSQLAWLHRAFLRAGLAERAVDLRRARRGAGDRCPVGSHAGSRDHAGWQGVYGTTVPACDGAPAGSLARPSARRCRASPRR